MQELQRLIDRAHHIVAFTGSGISAESGIPTYRGAGGLWQKYDPAKYADIDYFRRDPSYYWRFFRDLRFTTLEQARPNAAHVALAGLERAGKLQAVITQNIDGLHQQAGSRHVIELHGNARRFRCLDCEAGETLAGIDERLAASIPPTCRACGGVLRPEIVFFGEELSLSVMAEAERQAAACDLFLVIGSSLVVYPAARLPVQAKQSGGELVIINKEPTSLDGMADLVVHRSATEVLGAIA